MSRNKNISDLLKSKGFLFPENEKELEEFELLYPIENEEPADWDDPNKILERGLQKIRLIKETESPPADKINELRMVARKGDKLPQHVIDKMKAKHKKDDK